MLSEPPPTRALATERSLAGRSAHWLADRRLPLVVAMVGMILVLPSLLVGWQLDDYVHRVILSRAPAFADLSASSLDMFNFLNGDPDRTRRLMDLGLVPWWTLDRARLAFWRPMSALTHWVDYRLWPHWPALMHLQSIVWYGALCAAAALLYRQLSGSVWVAGLAAWLYAVDASHGFPVGWLANRNAILGTLFGLLALIAHDRWRRSGSAPGAYLGPLCLLVALLSAESGIATVGYLVAHALVLDKGSGWRRVLSLAPYGTVVLAWQLIYRHLGYGIWGVSPFYVNPVLESRRFAAAVLERGPILLFSEWALPSLESYASLMVSWPGVTRIVAVLFFTLLLLSLRRVLTTSERARFWALGQVLALLPACATLPHSRQLLFVGLGVGGLLAEFLVDLGNRMRQAPRDRWRLAPVGAFAVFLLGVHAVLAPFTLASSARGPLEFHRMLEGFAAGFPNDARVATQDVVMVNAPDAHLADLLHFQKLAKDEPVPVRTRRLASAATPVQVARSDPQTLVIRAPGGYFPTPGERGFRSEDFPMTRGQRINLTGLTVEVAEVTVDGRPTEVIFRFAKPLDDPSLRLLEWRGQGSSGRYVPFTPPRVGETLTLPSRVSSPPLLRASPPPEVARGV